MEIDFNKLDADTLPLVLPLLPEKAREIAACIGLPAALALVAEFGGCEVRFVKAPPPGTESEGGADMEVKESAIHRQVGGIKVEAFHHPVADRRVQPHRQRKLAVAAFLRATVRDLAPGHEAASLADARRG